MKKFTFFALSAAIAVPLVSSNAMAGGEDMSAADAMPAAEVVVDPKLARKGKKVAIRQCFACHDITENKQNRVGPPLWGIYGKSAAAVDGYEYSEAQKSKKDEIVWDEATLDAYLQDPKALVPDNKMAYPVAGMKVMTDKQRKFVIEFLKSLK